MISLKRYHRRREDIRRRIVTSKPEYGRCRIWECDQMTTATNGKGLNQRFCRRHVDQFRRHGSYYKTSYRVSELNPYRVSGRRWLAENREDRVVRAAVEGVNHLYWRAGREQEGFRLSGLAPEARAKYAWGRLRERKVDPDEVLAAWLAVEMRIRDDPQPDVNPEFKLVQAAKVIHRMAGGAHKRWVHDVQGRKVTTELHKHPASRGLVLRRIGKNLEKVASRLTEVHLWTVHKAHKVRILRPRGRARRP